LTERLKRENEPESTGFAVTLFQRFITRSAKKVGSNRAITEVLENLVSYGCPLVELDRNWKKVVSVYTNKPKSIL